MNEVFWMDEEELRGAYADLLTKLVRTEQMMVKTHALSPLHPLSPSPRHL